MTNLIALTDPGAAALALGLQVLGLPVDAAEILHQSGKSRLDAIDLVRFARTQPVKARLVTSNIARLATTPLPALVRMRDGAWLVAGRVADGKILIQSPFERAPRLVPLDDFGALWDGTLLLMARRASLTDPYQRFGIAWFVAAIQKYRQPLTEVLVGSFFVQLFALLTPLFFQVIIDKVFVQRGLSTLEVLSIGMIGLGVFEVVLGGIRAFLLAHTSNRIDVELGARLFKHLFALPLAYFQVRRVGDTIARVRELDTIRQFLTSSAMTLAIDLFFSLIFLAVLLIYSPALTLIVAGAMPLYVLLSLGLTPAFRRRLDERFRRGSENQSFLVEAVSGVETVKSMAVEPIMQRRWEEQLAAYVKSAFRRRDAQHLRQPGCGHHQQGHGRPDLFIGARLVIADQPHGGGTGRLQHDRLPAGRAGAAHRPALAGFPAGADLDRPHRRHPQHHARARRFKRGATSAHHRATSRFQHVSFRYRLDGQVVLRDVSLDIPAGQVVGVVGTSGSGKSTLGKLIQRLYMPESGRIAVDGNDLNSAEPSWLRRQIGVVLQENILFNRSVRDNIALADESDVDGARDRGGGTRRRARVHHGAAGRVQHHHRRARRFALRRPTPADRHRPRPGDQSSHPDLRRGDLRPRLRERGGDPGEHASHMRRGARCC